MLYTVGDSFTYGQELANPEQDAWPAVLARQLGMDLVNDGRPGAGNEYIVKRTIQAVSKYKPKLVVVAWTSCGRQEHADEKGVYDIWPGCTGWFDSDINLEHRRDLIKYITVNNNSVHEYRRWLRQVILLQSFLKNQNVEYIMCNVFDNQQRFRKLYKDNQGYYDFINQDVDRFLGWPHEGFVEWVYETPHGPGGHPLEQGHKIIAEKIYEACNIAR